VYSLLSVVKLEEICLLWYENFIPAIVISTKCKHWLKFIKLTTLKFGSQWTTWITTIHETHLWTQIFSIYKLQLNLKTYILWDIMLCSPLKVNYYCRRTHTSIFKRWHILLKFWLNFNRYPRRQNSSYPPLREPQNLHMRNLMQWPDYIMPPAHSFITFSFHYTADPLHKIRSHATILGH
jgi:hypothetical protein